MLINKPRCFFIHKTYSTLLFMSTLTPPFIISNAADSISSVFSGHPPPQPEYCLLHHPSLQHRPVPIDHTNPQPRRLVDLLGRYL